MTASLFAAIRNAADTSRTAIVMPDGTRWTYADLFARSARLAHRLRALGVTPGDRIAVQTDKGCDVLALYLASLRVGAVYLPLNDAYTAAELGYFLGDAEPRLLVMAPKSEAAGMVLAETAGARLATLGTDGRSGSLLAGIDALDPEYEDVDRAGDDLAAILYTSGTTGRSKGAMLTHDNLRSNAETLIGAWHYGASDQLLHALPFYHTHGLFVASNVTLLSGASMRLLPKFDPEAVFAALPAATVMMGVPTYYTRLLADPRLTRAATAHVRLFVSGSAPLLAETHDAWRERTGHMILERYGMTETNMNTSNPYEGERRPGTVGRPLPGVDVRIVEEASGQPLPAGEIGMIEVRGPNVFKGYWRMPEKTASEFRDDGFFITGDLGRCSEDGYVEIVGRGKDLIISGGLNVYPKEIETELDALDGVVESAVIGLPHADFGEAVVAVVVPRPGAQLEQGAVVATLAERLARFKLPKAVFFVEELPRNTMGKVQKSVLRAQYASAVTARAPSSD
jgi:malonyl-CoA/methylmalonyl-CoA synthetase